MEGNPARIPFAPHEEETIASMARWMRFVAVIGIVGGILMAFAVVVGVGVVSAGQGLGEAAPQWADVRRALDRAGPWLYGLLAVGLLAAAVSLWQNFALYHAGDYFQLVARTDVADLDYLAWRDARQLHDPGEPVGPDETALILYTSGTTGTRRALS